MLLHRRLAERSHHCRLNERGAVDFARQSDAVLLAPSGRLLGLAAVRADQPAAQLLRGFVRRRAVKRHQRRWHARDAHDARAPSVLRHRGHFDEVLASCDGRFKTMIDGGHSFVGCEIGFLCEERSEFYASRRHKQAKRIAKARAQHCVYAFSRRTGRSKFFFANICSTGNPRSINRFSTAGIA